METQGNKIKNNANYNETLTLTGSSQETFKLDIVKKIGTFDWTNKVPEIGTLIQDWYLEYKVISENAESNMETISERSDELCKDDSATDSLDQGVESIKTIESTFNDVKTQISNSIIDYSEIIDKYGKLAFKLAFSLLMSINAIIVTFITIKLIFSFLSCENKCINCSLKSLIHIFWNILGLVTFVLLLLGSIFTLIGTIGKDLTSVVNFLVSDANLNSEHIILLESAPSYLTKCINGDGNITGDLDLDISVLKILKN